jgi:hypothetical protein
MAALAAVVPEAGRAAPAARQHAAAARPVVIRLVSDEPDAAPDAATVVPKVVVARRGVVAPKVERSARPVVASVTDTGATADVGATRQVVFAERAGAEGPNAAATSSGTCPKASTCDVHALMPARWKTDSTGKLTLKWRYNDAGRRKLRAPSGLLESALKSGMAEWERWNSNVDFSYSGTTTALFGAKGSNGSCDDGTNTIGWARLEPGTIAQVISCVDKTGRRVVDADLALNVTWHWEDIQGEPESRHSYDIRSIVTHELGHFVAALADLYSNDAIYQTMMGNEKYGETRKRTLALGDIVGIQLAYPCGEGDTCPRKGIVND